MADASEHESYGSNEPGISDSGQAYVDALLASAEHVARGATDTRLSTSQIDGGIIASTLSRVGDLWQREISIADERQVTQNSIHVTALQREARRVARARAGYLATLAAPAGALHVVALPMLGRLQGVGHDVLMPGANVTAHAPASCARRLN